jgi:nitrogen fixation NifU-like protein
VCGDRVEIFLRVGAGNRIEDAGFEARACAVCVAAASLICDAAVGKTASEAAALAEKLAALLSGGGAASEAAAHGGWDSIPGDLRALEALKDFPARAGCAALAAAALRAALAGGGPGTAQGESADRGAGAVG